MAISLAMASGAQAAPPLRASLGGHALPSPATRPEPVAPASPIEGRKAAEAVQAATEPAWWAAFEEAPLARLQGQLPAAPGRVADARQVELTRAYVALRVQNVRLHNAMRLWQATQQEREQLAAQAPTRSAAEMLQANQGRAAVAQRLAASLADERDRALRRLLQLAGETEVVKQALADALERDTLPSFQRAAPARLPASVLLSRADVAEIGRHAGAHAPVSMLLSGWIGPAAQPAPLRLATLDGGEPPAEDTLRQAGQEVAWRLRVLLEAQARALAGNERLEAARLETLAMERRVQAGDADPVLMLQAFERLLAEGDAQAQAIGQLALAWVDLHAAAPGTVQALSGR